MTSSRTDGVSATAAAGAVVLPLALAQFICSFAGSNMNVAISTIADDLDTSVTGIQTTITLFTLTMAALMIPRQQADRLLGSQDPLHRRPRRVRGGRAAGFVREQPHHGDDRLITAAGESARLC